MFFSLVLAHRKRVRASLKTLDSLVDKNCSFYCLLFIKTRQSFRLVHILNGERHAKVDATNAETKPYPEEQIQPGSRSNGSTHHQTSYLKDNKQP